MSPLKYTIVLTLVLVVLFSESLATSAHEGSLNPRSAVPADNDDLSVFQLNRKLGIHMNLIRKVPKLPRAKESAAVPSQMPSLGLGYFLCLSLFLFLL